MKKDTAVAKLEPAQLPATQSVHPGRMIEALMQMPRSSLGIREARLASPYPFPRGKMAIEVFKSSGSEIEE